MDTITMSSFRTNMADTFNKVDSGQRIIIRRNNKYYTINLVQIDSITELEPNEVTKSAISEAKQITEEFESGKNDIEPVDLTSVESMLSSCGL